MDNEQVEVKSVVLENGIEYYLLTDLDVEGNKYLYLVNVNNDRDICIRKQEFEDGKEYLVTLDDEIEFTKVLDAFREKYIK